MVKNLVYLTLIIAAALTLGSIFRNMGGFDSVTVGFTIWALSPYALLAIASLFMSRFSPMRFIPVAALIAGVVMSAFAYYAYWIAMDHASSTEALVYVVVPLYMNVFGVFALAVGAMISALAARKV